MRKTERYIILLLSERNREYEYYHRSVHEIPDGRKATVNKIAEQYARDFYGRLTAKEDNGYYFHGGEVFVRVKSWQYLSESEYNILRQFL